MIEFRSLDKISPFVFKIHKSIEIYFVVVVFLSRDHGDRDRMVVGIKLSVQ